MTRRSRSRTHADYFYGPPGTEPPLPVHLLVGKAPGRARYYLDPVSGEPLAIVDDAARGYRWLHLAVHRLDAWPSLRARPAWDAAMLTLLAGVAVTSATGLGLGVRRLLSRVLARGSRPRGPAGSRGRADPLR